MFTAMLLWAPGASASPTGYWKLSLSIDYRSEGEATAKRCFPDPEQIAPSPLTGKATQRVSVRTVRPTTVEFHQAPNGVPVAQETNYTTAFRGKVSETRAGNLEAEGGPYGCSGADPNPQTDCGTKSITTGLYVTPLGGVGNWRGFVLELQRSPSERFYRCGLAAAQFELTQPLRLEIEAGRGKLTGRSGRLVFRKTKRLEASTEEEGVGSSATGTLTYTVTLVRKSSSS